MYVVQMREVKAPFFILSQNYENNFIANVFEKVFLDQKPNVA